jgi:glycosyltransferase involved in cell wall biosynthesis
MPQLARYFYPWADYVVAVCEGVAKDLVETAAIPNERVRVIYNPIVTPDFEAKARSPLQHSWFGPGKPPVILSAGRLTAQKDFPTLIQAFALVRKGRPVRLLILGEGEERLALEGLVKRLDLDHYVSMPGFVANPYPYMARAGVFALTSRWEGLPGVLIEALYCGAPLVATDCPGGSREILANGQYGQLVPVGDIVALAQAMEAALTSRMPHPPPESWNPFMLETVVDQYLSTLLGG